MELKTLLTADYLDIIFDQRNKEYGGYELRRTYNRRLKKAAAMALTTVVALFTLSFISITNANKMVTGTHIPPMKPIDLTPPPISPVTPKVIPPPASAPPVHVNTKIFTDKPQIEPNDQVKPKDEMPTITDMAHAVAGNTNSTGDDPDLAPTMSGSGAGKGSGTGVSDGPAKETAPLTWVSQMPQFSGDLNTYMSSHLQYPDAARDAGIEGRVIVSFVVNEDGSVTNATVVRGIGGGCDQEALRMISSMPKWKPGKQNGYAVKVLFSLVIKFELHE